MNTRTLTLPEISWKYQKFDIFGTNAPFDETTEEGFASKCWGSVSVSKHPFLDRNIVFAGTAGITFAGTGIGVGTIGSITTAHSAANVVGDVSRLNQHRFFEILGHDSMWSGVSEERGRARREFSTLIESLPGDREERAALLTQYFRRWRLSSVAAIDAPEFDTLEGRVQLEIYGVGASTNIDPETRDAMRVTLLRKLGSEIPAARYAAASGLMSFALTDVADAVKRALATEHNRSVKAMLSAVLS